MDSLEAISPIDGRYRRLVEPLAEIFSEKGLIKRRIKIEGEYLIYLSERKIGAREFSKDEKELIRKLSNISLENAQIVKDIETKDYKGIKATNHDVKAIEYYMKERLKETSLKDSLEWIHFGLTSEDINSFAYGLMIRDSLGDILIPTLDGLENALEEMAQKYKNVPMLARTHGQPASPTTFGKEFKVFTSRLKIEGTELRRTDIPVKLNGATGNYNALNVAYPERNWLEFTKGFVKRFRKENINDERKNLEESLITTQIESHDGYSRIFDSLRRTNVILIDFNKDMWRYISDGWIAQKSIAGEVGSSTMPHKINPIDFENSEGNLLFANSMFDFFSNKFPISRLQRDLSDSTVIRNIGVAFAHSLIGYKSILKGLSKIAVDEKTVARELRRHPEVIAEAYQTILRREGIEMPYEQLKELTRGKKPTMKDFRMFIEGLNVSDEVKRELRRIRPENYTGIAETLSTF